MARARSKALGNIIGMPVRGYDFFDRKREIERAWERLQTDNVLLLAPRRVGKTSLMLRMADQGAEHGFRALYVNVQDATSEGDFAEKLYRKVEDKIPRVARSGRSPRDR